LPIILFVRLKPNWGYAVRRQPQSKMRINFSRPPPSTLIGALAYSLKRILGDRREIIVKDRRAISSANFVKNMLLSVNIRMIGETLNYGSLYRINMIYRGTALSAITALPSAFTYSNRDIVLDIVYVFDESKLSLNEIPENILERAGWGITRIGSRESIFSAEKVSIDRVEVREFKKTETSFSFIFNEKIKYKGSVIVEYVADWRKTDIGSYLNAPLIGIFYPKGRVTVFGEFLGIEYTVDAKKEVIIVG